jgi:hypothetical protein
VFNLQGRLSGHCRESTICISYDYYIRAFPQVRILKIELKGEITLASVTIISSQVSLTTISASFPAAASVISRGEARRPRA